jgi:integrase
MRVLLWFQGRSVVRAASDSCILGRLRKSRRPTKFDRARVIPIGDGLGRVIAEIIRHVKAFYGTDRVPDCGHYDASEKRALPRAPYLLQGCRHPSPLAFAAIRTRLARLSRLAELRCADGSELVVRPHDCRRAFASEHLNNNTPVHVIQALLGHASLDTGSGCRGSCDSRSDSDRS